MDVYILQTGSGSVNDMLMEMLIMISACKMASAAKVTVVIPCFPYARQADAPYKRNGQPRRSSPVRESSAAVQKQLEQQRDRKNAKLKQLHKGAVSDADEPLFSGSMSATSSTSPVPKIITDGNRPQSDAVARLQVASTGDTTLISSPVVANVSSLGLVKSGYRHWVARSGTLVCNMIMAAGANHIISMDLHDPSFQGFFDIPLDNLFGSALMIKYIKEKIENYFDAVIVSPDAGGAKRAANIAHKLNMEFAMIHKERKIHLPNAASHLGVESPPAPGEDSFSQENMVLVGNVKGRVCILVDDIADTSSTITKAAAILCEKGATKVYAIITHGVLSGDAVQRVLASKIDRLIVSNTVPQTEHKAVLGDKLRVFDVAPIFAEAIRRIHHGESVSYLFEPVDI